MKQDYTPVGCLLRFGIILAAEALTLWVCMNLLKLDGVATTWILLAVFVVIGVIANKYDPAEKARKENNSKVIYHPDDSPSYSCPYCHEINYIMDANGGCLCSKCGNYFMVKGEDLLFDEPPVSSKKQPIIKSVANQTIHTDIRKPVSKNVKTKEMEIEDMVIDYITGFCEFSVDDSLAEVTKSVPHGYGAYKFRANTPDGEILYIGKSGTSNNDGSFKDQDLRKRLNAKQDGMRRVHFLRKKLTDSNGQLQKIVIEWFILKDPNILPAYLEAYFIQQYYAEHHRLPSWNEAF